jgi:hypothetical protein
MAVRGSLVPCPSVEKVIWITVVEALIWIAGNRIPGAAAATPLARFHNFFNW